MCIRDSQCGVQLPGFNAAPAFAYDGTIYVVSKAEANSRYSFIASISPADLTPNWSASLRDHLHDGCGVTTTCADGAPVGIDPYTGQLPAGRVDNDSSSSPVALPHGGVLYGAFTFYNADRGHLMQFDDGGRFVASYDFGWDTTPAVISDLAGDRVVLKDNHYPPDPTIQPGPYYFAELDHSLTPIWQFQNMETQSCTRQPDGTIACKTTNPWGFEWCVNAPVVDRVGTVYGNSEDGNLYAINGDGTLRDRIFLDQALGASYTPLAIDHVGRIYALNAGHLFVIGSN